MRPGHGAVSVASPWSQDEDGICAYQRARPRRARRSAGHAACPSRHHAGSIRHPPGPACLSASPPAPGRRPPAASRSPHAQGRPAMNSARRAWRLPVAALSGALLGTWITAGALAQGPQRRAARRPRLAQPLIRSTATRRWSARSCHRRCSSEPRAASAPASFLTARAILSPMPTLPGKPPASRSSSPVIPPPVRAPGRQLRTR